MKNDHDAFGHEIHDHFLGSNNCEVIERDDGYLDVSDRIGAYFTEYDEWLPHQKKAIRLARGRVLDIGCGAGRHAIHLQRQGLDVTGIDQSPLAVSVCRKRGLCHAVACPVTRIPAGLGPFDTILLLGNNFGLLENEKRGRWLLGRFHALTTDRARIIAESMDPHLSKDPIHVSYRKRNRSKGRMPGQIRIRVRYRERATPWFDYLLVSQKEMTRIVKSTGWRITRFIESKGPFYIAVIEKKP